MRRKNYFRFVLVCFLITIAACSCFCITYHEMQKAKNYTTNYYPLSTSVYHISYLTDIVTVVDSAGNLWQFTGVDDWQIKDICACIMDSKGTAEIKDDEIISVRYSGTWGCGE